MLFPARAKHRNLAWKNSSRAVYIPQPSLQETQLVGVDFITETDLALHQYLAGTPNSSAKRLHCVTSLEFERTPLINWALNRGEDQFKLLNLNDLNGGGGGRKNQAG